MFDQNHIPSTTANDLLKPKYNSTLKIIKQIEDVQANQCAVKLPDLEVERINEKASAKLNQNDFVYQGLIAMQPNEDEFLREIDNKYRQKVKPQINLTKTHTDETPDIMEFYPDELCKEYPQVEIDYQKPNKIHTIKASSVLLRNPIDNYFKWN